MNTPDLILKAKAKEKEKRLKAKEKEKHLKEKEKAKEKEKRLKAKEKEKRLKEKEKEKRLKAKEKEKRLKAKEKEKRLKNTKRVKKGGQGDNNWESQTINDYWISYLNVKERTFYEFVQKPPKPVDLLPIDEKPYDYSNNISDLLKQDTEKKTYFGEIEIVSEPPKGEWSSTPATSGFLSSIFNKDPVGTPYVPPPKKYIFNFFGIIPVQVKYLLDLIIYTANKNSHRNFDEYHNQLVDLSRIFKEKELKKGQKDTQPWKDTVIQNYGFQKISPSFNIIKDIETKDGNTYGDPIYMTTAERIGKNMNIYDFYGMTLLESEYLLKYYDTIPPPTIDEKDLPAFENYMLDLRLVVKKINSNSSIYIRPTGSRLSSDQSLIIGIFGPYSINRNLSFDLYNNADKDYGFDRAQFRELHVYQLGFLKDLFEKSDPNYANFIKSIINSVSSRILSPPARPSIVTII